MIKVICCGLLPVIITFICAPSYAAFTLIPSISVKEVYNDNIFLTETDRADDFITSINPKIVLKYSPSRTINLDLDYGLNFTFYREYSNLNDTNLNETQRLNFQTMIKPSSRIYIHISDTYERVPVDIRNPTSPGNLFLNLTDSNVFTISPNIKYPLMPSLLTHIGYRYTNTWYEVDEGNDSDSHHFFLSMTKQFSTKLSVAANYNYFAHRPNISSDYDSHEGSVSAFYKLTKNLVVTGEAGYAVVHFDNDFETESSVWAASADYYVKALRLLVGGGYSNSYSKCSVATTQEKILTSEDNLPSATCSQLTSDSINKNSVTNGISKNEKYNLHINVERKIKIIVTAYYAVDEFVESDREDKVKGINTELSFPIMKSLTGRLYGMYENQKFFPENTEFDRYSLRSEILYNLSRRISTNAGYEYNLRESDTGTSEYNNIAWVGATLTF